MSGVCTQWTQWECRTRWHRRVPTRRDERSNIGWQKADAAVPDPDAGQVTSTCEVIDGPRGDGEDSCDFSCGDELCWLH